MLTNIALLGLTAGLSLAMTAPEGVPFTGSAMPPTPRTGGAASGYSGETHSEHPPAAVRPLWWEAGHAVVCDIAWREMSPRARDTVRDLIALDPAYDEFGPSCYWPDVIRGEPGFEVFTPSHYVNLPPGAAGFDAARDCAETLCVVEAIEMFAGRLRDPIIAPEGKLVALKFLGHFVGDIHQPLHAGYAADRGGNDVAACIPGDDDTNLHAVWDGFIVNRRLAALELDWKRYGARLQADVRPVERELWRSLDPRVWAEESYALMEDEAYEDVDRHAGEAVECFGESFVLRHLETTERRLKQAGVRLATLLDDVFGST